MDREQLTKEQREKLKACQSPEDMLALVNELCIKLTDEELDEISGGTWDGKTQAYHHEECPHCGKQIFWYDDEPTPTVCVLCKKPLNFD